MNAVSWYERFKAWVLSIIHYKTIAGALRAEARGIGIAFTRSLSFLTAADKKELLSVNPTKHEEVTARRRLFFAFYLLLWALAGLALWLRVPFGLYLFVWIHVAVFFFIGWTEPVMNKVQTKKIAGESLIRKVFDDITLSAAQRKEENGPTTRIVVPPARTAMNTGYETTVRIHMDGKPDKALSPAGEDTIAHKLGKDKTEVFTYPVKGNASLIRLLALDEDPWSLPPSANPLVIAPRPFSLWRERCDLGVLADGSRFLDFLVEEGDGGGWLIGGSPRKGKSIFISNLLVYILLDPASKLHMIDGKAVDFAEVKPVASTYIGDAKLKDRDLLRKSIQHFEWLQEEINRRREILLSAGVGRVSEAICQKYNLSLEWTVIDELAVITEDMMSLAGKDVKRLVELMQYVVRMGPAFGVFCILATQRPSEKSVPVTVRDLIVRRTAFYIGSVYGSHAILDKTGWQNRADQLDPDQKGVSITLGVGKFRGHLVEQKDLQKVVAYAASIRASSRPGLMAANEEETYPEPIATILRAFRKAEKDVIETSELIRILHDFGLTSVNAKNLAESLKPFAISPGRPYIGGIQTRGYKKEDFLRVPKVTHGTENLPTYPDSETDEDTDEDGPEDGFRLMAANEEDT